MIPVVTPREQFVAANGIFTLTLNGAFAVVVRVPRTARRHHHGQPRAAHPPGGVPLRAGRKVLPGRRDPDGVDDDHEGGLARRATQGEAVTGVFGQLREGVAYIRANRPAPGRRPTSISASLIGVVAVLGLALPVTNGWNRAPHRGGPATRHRDRVRRAPPQQLRQALSMQWRLSLGLSSWGSCSSSSRSQRRSAAC